MDVEAHFQYSDPMIIATWNVNSIRSRIENFLEWLKMRKPDVVLLQEIKCQEDQFPYDVIEDQGYNIALTGQKSYNGVAILSRYPLEDIQRGIPEFDDNHARYIEAVTRGVRVASIYVPNGKSVKDPAYTYKMHFYQALKVHVENLIGNDEKIILGGDYNVALDDADVYDVEKFQNRLLFTLEERLHLRQLCTVGMYDSHTVYEKKFGEILPRYTWWDYRTRGWEDNRGLRIDYLFLSPQAADSLKNYGIDQKIRSQTRPSDHVPVWVDIV